MHGLVKPVWKDERNRGDGYETQQSSTDSTLNTGPWLQPWWSQHRYQNSTSRSVKPCWWICFSRWFKLQLTAELRSVYSIFFKHVLYQSWSRLSDKMLGAPCTSCFYCFSWYTAGPHPNHGSSLSHREWKSCEHEAGKVGWRLNGILKAMGYGEQACRTSLVTAVM